MTSWPRSNMPDTATDSSTGGPVLGAMRTNAVIANLIHPLVYAPRANMTQDALDDLRVVDQLHDAHLVMTLGTQQRINFPDFLDQLAPRS